MKFFPEDKIITAEEARDRTLAGYEDSIDREAIRRVMANVKQSSFYGYRKTTLFQFSDKKPMSNVVRFELEQLGYTVEDEEHPAGVEKHGRIWTISW